jgi:hypothetical protein
MSIEDKNSKIFNKLLLLKGFFTLIFIGIGYKYLFNFYNIPLRSGEFNLSTKNEYIERLTSKDDKIYLLNVSTYNYILYDHLPASRIASLCPWFSELYEDVIINDLKINKPKIIDYDRNNSVWGYIYKDFAPELDSYIRNEYMFSASKNLWIRKDMIE